MVLSLGKIYGLLLYIVLFLLSGMWFWPVNEESNPLLAYKIYGDVTDNLMYMLCALCISFRLNILRIDFIRNYHLMIFLGVLLLSALLSEDRFTSLKSLIRITLLVAFILTVIRNIGLKKVITIFESFFVITIIISSIVIFITPEFGVMGGGHEGAFRGLMNHKNSFGFYLVVAFTYLININSKSYLTKFVICLCALMIPFSQSTTSIILLAISSLIYLYTYYLEGYKIKYAVYMLSFIIIIISLYFQEEIVENSFALIGKDADFSGRTILWDYYIGIIYDNLWFGFGDYIWSDGFKNNFIKTTAIPVFYTPHNSYLSIIVSYGIIVLVYYLYLIFLLLGKLIKKNYLKDYSPLYFCIPVFIIRGFFESGLSVSVSLYFVMIIILISIESRPRI